MTHIVGATARRLALLLTLAPAVQAAGQAEARYVRASSAEEVGAWEAAVSRLVADGSLRVRQVREDTMIAGREHVRLSQFHRGVPVVGGELVVQSEAGRARSVFGMLYENVQVEAAPRLSAAEALRAVAGRGFAPFGPAGGPELVVLPRENDFLLAYRLRARAQAGLQVNVFFVDAASGEVVLEYNDVKTQAVGVGTGVLNDQKKMSTRASGGTFLADDRLRPPVIATYDFRGDLFHLLSVDLLAIPAGDFASDADNVWSDGSNVDAHAYLGYVYDYFFLRHGRRGLDNANRRLTGITHPVRRADVFAFPNTEFPELYCNALYLGEGIMIFGEGLPFPVGGQTCDFLAGGLDVVAHELAHGVTDYSSGLIYRNESGALNESFSDIMGTAVEYYYQAPGSGLMRADYLMGEDVLRPGGFRSMQSPILFGDPDHYSIRFLGAADNGGVHINSGIPNNAYYLAVEGGVNRVSGLAVQGVGQANREQMERVFYRAFTTLLTPASNFSQARAATIQAARDLFGVGSAPERAVTQAWTAVGVN